VTCALVRTCSSGCGAPGHCSGTGSYLAKPHSPRSPTPWDRTLIVVGLLLQLPRDSGPCSGLALLKPGGLEHPVGYVAGGVLAEQACDRPAVKDSRVLPAGCRSQPCCPGRRSCWSTSAARTRPWCCGAFSARCHPRVCALGAADVGPAEALVGAPLLSTPSMHALQLFDGLFASNSRQGSSCTPSGAKLLERWLQQGLFAP